MSFIPTRPPTTYVHTRFCPQHDCWWCLFTTRRFHKSHLLIHTHAFSQIISSLGSFFKFTVNFWFRRATHVLWGVSHIHMTQHRLYLQCSLVYICLCSRFETSRRFLWGAKKRHPAVVRRRCNDIFLFQRLYHRTKISSPVKMELGCPAMYLDACPPK